MSVQEGPPPGPLQQMLEGEKVGAAYSPPRLRGGVGGGSFANPARGEAAIIVGGETLVLRPSFEALVAAEEELGPLFALVERAAEGRLSLAEMAGLFWHCSGGAVARERLGAALVEAGLARATPMLKTLLRQILLGASTSSA